MSESRPPNKNRYTEGTYKNRQSGSTAASVLRFLLGIIIIVASIGIVFYWISSKPKAVRKPRETKPTLVELAEVLISDYKVTVDVMGTVVPARSIGLTSRVSGEIVKLNEEFFPGGHLSEGNLVAEIDKADYLLLLEESELALEKAEIAIEQSEFTIEQSELSIEQSDLSIEQSDLAIERSTLDIEQSEFAIEQRKGDIIKTEKDLLIEKGQQKIAQREYEVLGETIAEKDEDLVLRRPQLKSAEAVVESAKSRLREAQAAKKSAEAAKKAAQAAMHSALAAKKSAQTSKKSSEAAKKSAEAAKKAAQVNLEKAKLSLKRTDILTPFNGIIQEKKVEIGSQVSPGTPIVTIVDSDEYWIKVSVPVDRLKWIKIPDSNETAGSLVRIYHEAAWGKDVFRVGEVKRLMTDVEAQGRMAILLVSVNDPFSLRPENASLPRLILGAYVRVDIEASELKNVVRVPRASLRDNDTVWIMTPDNSLEVREVEVIWSDKEAVYATNHLRSGELLIISDLAAPVVGMKLRTSDMEESPAETSNDDIDKE